MTSRAVIVLLGVACLGLLWPSAVHAVPPEDPTVLEDYDPSVPEVEYTVINPQQSSAGDIVGFVIDFDPADYPYGSWLDTANLWEFQKLTAEDWTSTMASQGYPYWSYPLTWQEFFGGLEYPFDTLPAAGYFVAYSEVATDEYEFVDPDQAISPGESLGQFFIEGRALSTFYLAYVSDASTESFGPDGLPWISGEAVPEPSALVLLGMGGIALLAWRRRRGGR